MKIPVLFAEKALLEKRGHRPQKGARSNDSARLSNMMHTLEESDRDILSTYPASFIKARVEDRLAERASSVIEAEDKRSEREPLQFRSDANLSAKSRAIRAVSLASAACLALALAFVASQRVEERNPELLLAQAASGERSKGASMAKDTQLALGKGELYAYRKTGNAVDRLEKGAKVNENDVIQISYFAGSDRFGVILSVDGNGIITRHYPDGGPDAGILKASGEIPLDFSYKLDNAPSFERFILISAPAVFTVQPVISAIEKASRDESFTTMDLSKVLPQSLNSSDIVLIK